MKLLDINQFSTLSESDCIQIQQELSKYVVEKNTISLDDIKTVAGVDIAYWKKQRTVGFANCPYVQEETEWAVCCIVVLDIHKKTVIEQKHVADKIKFPYIPGCFAFRELPLVIQTAAQLNHPPNLFLFDGNGILHPRMMGLATHASFYLNTPTIGIAKRYFQVESAQYCIPENTAGSYTDIIKEHKILGRAIRTHTNVKPIFASVGNYIDIDTVTKLALQLTDKQSHIPTPTRYADLDTHQKRAELLTAKF